LPSISAAMRSFCAALPACAMARPTISAPRKGSTTRPLPRLSKTTATSKPAPPKPPTSSGKSAPSAPISASCDQRAASKPSSLRAMRSRSLKPYCSAMKRSSESASMRRSSVCSKFTVRSSSQAQDHLGDDVLLDLVAAAEDRQLAVVEVVGRGRGGLGLAQRLARMAGVLRRLDEGLGIGADRAPDQRQDLLADLGAADLEHGAFRARHAAAGHRGDHAQVGGLHVLQV